MENHQRAFNMRVTQSDLISTKSLRPAVLRTDIRGKSKSKTYPESEKFFSPPYY